MAGEIDMFGQPVAVLEYKNEKPLDLLELTSSLRAFGDAYKRYAAQEFPEGVNARLAVGRMRSGSIITTLVPILETVDWMVGQRDFIGPFVAQFGDAMDLIRSFPPKARELPKPVVRAAKEVVAPIARDTGGQLNIYAADGSTIITNIYNFGPSGAKSLRKHADIILAGMPEDLSFEEEPMILHQLRDGPPRPGPTGDYGIIDRFGRDPVRIRWMSEQPKTYVLDQAENVFDLVYFVTGTARTAGGQVVSFDIRRVDDVAMRPPGDRHI